MTINSINTPKAIVKAAWIGLARTLGFSAPIKILPYVVWFYPDRRYWER